MTTSLPMSAFVRIAALLLFFVPAGQAVAGFANGDTTKANLLGSVPSVISVDPVGGSAGMSYPLEVPPGRAGMQPDLSLSYSSGSDEPGMLGRGWRLSLPAIQRSTRYGQPSFDWAVDGFTLLWGGGAKELVKVSDQTVGGVGMREYRTLSESFRRIRSNTLPGGFTYWEVWDGSGRVWQFGNPGADSNPTQSGEFLYALNRVQDEHGNYMTLSWLIDSGPLSVGDPLHRTHQRNPVRHAEQGGVRLRNPLGRSHGASWGQVQRLEPAGPLPAASREDLGGKRCRERLHS